MKQLTFSKRQIDTLREGNAYVAPNNSASNISDIANDIAVTQKSNPTDKNFVLDTSDYNGNSTTDEPTLDVKAKNAQDAQNKINQMKQNPDTKRLMDKGSRINIALDENKIKYTKQELNKILFA